MSEKIQRTEINDLGEFGLIERLADKINLQNASSIKGIGDDAAVIDSGDHYTLVTTDMLVEGIHFDLSYTPLKHLGYKAIAVNVSDIAAMNGVPQQVTVGLALSNRFSLEAIEEIYAGIRAACESFKVDLVGGDTTASRSGLVLSITAIGKIDKDKVVYRSNAKKHDIVCVSGDLGGAFIGLQILEREKAVFLSNPEMQPDLKDKNYVVQRQLKPEARMDLVYELRDLGVVPTSMIDISDGLASELFHISKNSGVGINIYEDKLPIHGETFNNAVEFNLDPVTCALNGGKDYELLFTIDQKDFPKVKNVPDIAFIGVVVEKEKRVNLISKAGNIVPIQAQGWKHF